MPLNRFRRWINKLSSKRKINRGSIQSDKPASIQIPVEERLESKIRNASLADKLKLLKAKKRDLNWRVFGKACRQRGIDPDKTFTLFYERLILYNSGEIRLWVGEVETKIKEKTNALVALYRSKKIDEKILVRELNKLHLWQVQSYALKFAEMVKENHLDIAPLLPNLKAAQ